MLVNLIPWQVLQPNRVTAAEERLILSLLYHPLMITVYKIILLNSSSAGTYGGGQNL